MNTEILAEHQFRPGFERCTCGQKIPTTLHSKYHVDFPNYQAMARHQMEALAAATPEVTTVEELDALPVGSVVRGEEGDLVAEKIRHSPYLPYWVTTGNEVEARERDLLPARVLYRPEA